jgi:hypothetical protein
MNVDSWSLVSGIVSLLMGGLSIWLSLHFYTQTNKTERSVANSLTKIETQADALQKINAKWMDRLTKYVTEDRSQPIIDDSIVQLLEIVRTSHSISATVSVPEKSENDEYIKEIVNCYIIIYYYAALSNYWAQFMLPDINDFNEADQFHVLVKNSIDSSAADFNHFANLLGKLDPARLEAAALHPLLEETRDLWRMGVRGVAETFLRRNRPN